LSQNKNCEELNFSKPFEFIGYSNLLHRFYCTQERQKKELHDSIQTQKILNIDLRTMGEKMSSDSDIVSGWFVLNAGFKVQARCPACHSPNVSYHKSRRMGLKGISSKSQGLTPACMDCEKNLPTKVQKESKHLQTRGQRFTMKDFF
jgi:hypothetical protein